MEILCEFAAFPWPTESSAPTFKDEDCLRIRRRLPRKCCFRAGGQRRPPLQWRIHACSASAKTLDFHLHQPTLGVNPREVAAAPFLVVLRGIIKGKGSHTNPAKRFAWEKEEQRNGRGLSAASGRQDEGCGVCSDATPTLPIPFSPPAAFSFDIKGKGG